MEIHAQGTLNVATASYLFHLAMGRNFPLDPSNEDWMGLVSRPFPDVNQDVTDFRDAYWLAETFSKVTVDIGIDRELVAMESFHAAEQMCAETNRRLCDFESRPHLPVSLLKRARSVCAAVLGRFDVEQLLHHCDFGPGASFSLPRRQSHRSNKWRCEDVTSGCLPYACALVQYLGIDHRFTVVEGNRITTVPKNSKTDRTIAIEPTWNSFIQKGIGGMIRHRLQRRIGLLREDAQAYHREMARQASLDGQLATIDLRSASDSVSLALCEALLPEDWLRAVLATRSPQGILPNGEKVVYEKVSSMGNGYTFELETLLFYSLVRAVCPLGTVTVYGDDIICPADKAGDVIDLLLATGFLVNEKKTFVTGPFRESCGGHYHSGHEVTPPYVRSSLEEPMDFVAFANAIRSRACQRFHGMADKRFKALWSWLSSHVRFRGPVTSSGAIHCELDEAMSHRDVRWNIKLQQWSFGELAPIKNMGSNDFIEAVYASLWRGVTEESTWTKPIGWRPGRSVSNGWCGPGRWLDQVFLA